MNETSVNLTVDRNGIVDLLIKNSQALRITAELLKSLGMMKDSAMAEISGAYLEALAAALERDIDEALVAQFVPLIRALAVAMGDEDIEEQQKVLQEQTDEIINMIKQSRGQINEEPLAIMIDSEVIH